MGASKSVSNMPGPGGSLGLCAVCGDTFMKEILLGENVKIMGLDGMDKDFCVHLACFGKLAKAISSHDWHDIPQGPLREAFEKADKAARESAGTLSGGGRI
jgi:hypothetical protein